MSAVFQVLIAVHVAANLVWIGSILCVARLAATQGEDARAGARFAYEIYRRYAIPAFAVSFVTAALRLGLSARLYFVETHYMHPKLLFAVIVIALHHIIGARAKAVSAGRRSTPGPMGVMALLLLISATAATLFVVLKPF